MVEILDYRGEPMRRSDMQEPQTARVAPLPEPIGAHPSRGLTPAKLARILQEAEEGDLEAQLDLGEDMEEKDGHIFAELSKRRRALLGLDWTIEPPRDATREEERATDLVRELVQDLDLDELVLDLADAVGKAFACVELDWGRESGVWTLDAAELRPQRWFRISREADETIALRDGTGAGAPLQPFGWIAHVHKVRSGHLARASLHRVLAWPFLFKNYSVRDLAEFLEIYGLPLRLGTYPHGSSDQEKATLMQAVVNIGHSAAGIIPEGMAVDFKEAAKGASSPFMAMVDWCERTQSKAILGATLTSQADRGSNTNALGNVHNEVRRDLLISDARQIARTLTSQLLYPLAALNSAAVRSLRRAPRWVYDTQEPEDMQAYSQALPRLVDVGLRVPERWARERLRIPEPEEDEPVLARQPGMPGPSAALRAGTGRRRAAVQVGGERPTSERQRERLAEEADGVTTAMVERIRGIVDSAESLEDLQVRLESAFDGEDAAALGAVLAEALAAAELAGRYDLLQEIG